MKTPYLIQRLKAPHGGINPFCDINRSLQEAAKDLFSFDYMGAAEFEWGAVPTALRELGRQHKLMTTFEVDKVYVICPESIKDEVKAWIELTAKDQCPNRTKERVSLKESLECKKYNDFKGWLKIEDDRCVEPWMFFIDRQMFENVCQILGIAIAV